MNISVKYKEQRGGCEAEVWLSIECYDANLLPRGVGVVAQQTMAILQDEAKKSVRKQLDDCGCTHRGGAA